METTKLKVEGYPQYERIGQAIVNTDTSGYEAWLASQMEKKSLEDRVARLEAMLAQFLQKEQ
jgi:hypothetical protein